VIQHAQLCAYVKEQNLTFDMRKCFLPCVLAHSRDTGGGDLGCSTSGGALRAGGHYVSTYGTSGAKVATRF
jgi:hypothetical protein